MKRKLLPLVLAALLLNGIAQPVFGQAPWVASPGAPTYFTAPYLGKIRYLSASRPNVLWGLYRSPTTPQSNWAPVIRTADNGQTWQTATIARTSYVPSRTPTNMGVEVVDMSALDANNAWALGYDVANSNSVLLPTTSDANGFAAVATTLPTGARHIHLFTATTGVALPDVNPGALQRFR